MALVDLVVLVCDEADLVDVERLGVINVRNGHGDELEPEIHG